MDLSRSSNGRFHLRNSALKELNDIIAVYQTLRKEFSPFYFSNSSKGGQTEGYEKTSVVHKDMKFHRFMKRVSLCPEQCLRLVCPLSTHLYQVKPSILVERSGSVGGGIDWESNRPMEV